jgi:hypothetical protein
MATRDSKEKILWRALEKPGSLIDLKDRSKTFLAAHVRRSGWWREFVPGKDYPLGRGSIRRLLTQWMKDGLVESVVKPLGDGRSQRIYSRRAGAKLK